MKKITFVHVCTLRKLFRALMCVSLCTCTGSLFTSCVTVPGGTYLKSTSLSEKSKVAIVASVSAPGVSYSSAKEPTSLGLLPWFPVIGLGVVAVAAGTEAAIRSSVDHGHAEKVREQVDLSYLEERMAQSFIQYLKKGSCFQSMEYVTDKNQDGQKLSSEGYGAIIRLLVREISLKRIEGDSVRLNVYVRGSMEYLSSGKVVWDREEHVLSPEIHPLDYYKENGLKELDMMLEKAGRNLAYDFVYLK